MGVHHGVDKTRSRAAEIEEILLRLGEAVVLAAGVGGRQYQWLTRQCCALRK